jgi:hypothetical protein
MKPVLHFSLVAGIFCAGFWAGQSNLTTVSELKAFQDQPGQGPSEDAGRKIRAAQAAAAEAQATLENEGLYVPAIEGTNAYAVMVGGINAVQDLERGLGVDPETFVGLYAGLATADVAPKLGKDESGRLTYNDQLIRLYPKTRLRQLQAQREKIANADK